MKVVSIFTGLGGLDIGFKRQGFEIVAGCEKNPEIVGWYHRHSPSVPIESDIFKMLKNPPLLMRLGAECDGVIGGPPCQAWSVAGSGLGEQDRRGQLFFRYIELIARLSPKFFVAENVAGISYKRHKAAYADIVAEFTKLGYNVQVYCLNAMDFGVAQRRERMFFIGFKKQYFEGLLKFPALPKVTLRESIGDIEAMAFADASDAPADTGYWYSTDTFSPRYMSRNRRASWDEQGFTVQASGRHCQLHPGSAPMQKEPSGKFVFTGAFRRMTVRECARLQGFSDLIPLPNAELGYVMVGNAVPVVLAEAVAHAIKGVFGGGM